MLDCIPTLSAQSFQQSCLQGAAGFVLIQAHEEEVVLSLRTELINYIKDVRANHIMILEDADDEWPLQESDQSLISQVLIGEDVQDRKQALARAMKLDVDVLYYGAVSDAADVSLLLDACEAGMLVLAEFPFAHGRIPIINKYIYMMPAEKQHEVRMQCARYLLGILSITRNITLLDNTQKRLCDVMLKTPAIANIIRDDMTHAINMFFTPQNPEHMTSIDHALCDLFIAEQISKEELMYHACDHICINEQLKKHEEQ